MKKTGKRSSKFWLCLALVLAFIGAAGASLVQSSGGSVEVKDLRWETSSGHHMSALLLKPKNVSAESPVPAIVTSHGWYNTREMQDLNYVEYARRGYVVLSIDMYGHGNSETIEDGTWWNPENNANGMYDAVKLLDSLPYVDSARIGITGHSNGARASRVAMEFDNDAPQQLIAAALLVSNDAIYSDSPTASYIYDGTGEFVNLYGSRNVGIVACQYDEFFHRVVKEEGGTPAYTAPRDYLDQATAQSFLHFGENPDGLEHRVDRTIYTQEIDGEEAIRAIYNPNQIHPWAHFSSEVVTMSLEFFDAALGTPNPIAPSSQTWQWKVCFNFIGLVGFVMFFVNVLLLLAKTAFFAPVVVNEQPQMGPAPKGTGKIWFWGSLALGTVFSMIFYYTTYNWVVSIRPAFFNQLSPFYIGLWSAACGLFTLLLLILSYQLYGKKQGVNLRETGVFIGGIQLLKTVLLALTGVALSYCLVFLSDFFFHTDFRIWVLTIKAFTPDKFSEILRFLPFFLVYYVINSVSINGFNFVQIGKKKWLNTVIMMIFNGLAPLLLVIWIYSTFFATGYLPHESMSSGIGGSIIGIWLFPVIVILPVAAWISRRIYKATQNPYLGGIAMAVLVTTFTCTNTLTLL